MLLPSKHLLVLCLQDMSWRRLQHAFSVTIFRLPRRLKTSCKYFLKTSWRHLERRLEDVFKTSSRHLGRRKIVTLVLKTSWRHVLKTSWRHVLKKSWRHVLRTSWRHVFKTSWRQEKYLLGLSVSNHGLLTNLNQYLTNLYLTNLYFTNLRPIQNALIRTQ